MLLVSLPCTPALPGGGGCWLLPVVGGGPWLRGEAAVQRGPKRKGPIRSVFGVKGGLYGGISAASVGDAAVAFSDVAASAAADAPAAAAAVSAVSVSAGTGAVVASASAGGAGASFVAGLEGSISSLWAFTVVLEVSVVFLISVTAPAAAGTAAGPLPGARGTVGGRMPCADEVGDSMPSAPRDKAHPLPEEVPGDSDGLPLLGFKVPRKTEFVAILSVVDLGCRAFICNGDDGPQTPLSVPGGEGLTLWGAAVASAARAAPAADAEKLWAINKLQQAWGTPEAPGDPGGPWLPLVGVAVFSIPWSWTG